MSFLTGEFECKLDPKSRMMVPSGLKKKLPEIETEGFFLTRGFGEKKHLVIYTIKQWEKKLEELSLLNEYEEDNIKVIRYLTRGATELKPDAAGRVVLPKFLLDYDGIKSDVVLSLLINKIEVWDANTHKALLDEELDNYAPLIQKVLGNKNGRSDG